MPPIPEPDRSTRFAGRPILFALCLLLFSAMVLSGCIRPAEDPATFPGITLYASFNDSVAADFAAADPQPLASSRVEMAGKGRRGGCVDFPYGSTLTYDAPGNLFAERGTVSLWWKPAEPMGRTSFPLVRISYAQHSTWSYVFASVDWSGSHLAASFTDRDMEDHRASAPDDIVPRPDKWYHVALAWSETDGFRLYLDGKEIAGYERPLHLAANLDQVGIMTQAVTPHHTAGTERRAYVDELMIFNRPLAPAEIKAVAGSRSPGTDYAEPSMADDAVRRQWSERYGWGDPGVPPRIDGPTRIRAVKLPGALDLGKFWIKGSDGKRETTWPPLMSHGYKAEGKVIRFWCAPEPFDLVAVQGNLAGKVYGVRGGRRSLLLERPAGSGEKTYVRLRQTVRADSIVIERESGVLGDINLFAVSAGSGRWSGGRSFVVGGAASSEVKKWVEGRYPPGQRSLAGCRPVGSPPGNAETGPADSAAMPIVHLAVPAGDDDLALGAVTLRLGELAGRLPGNGPIKLNLTVKDPLYPVRDLANVDFDLDPVASAETAVTLDIRDIIIRAGRPLWLTVACDNPAFGPASLDGAEVVLNLVAPATARKEFIPDRLVHLKTSFQMLSEARPWMRLGGRRSSADDLRRGLKLIDELFLLLEDLKHFDPDNQIAAAYRGWVFRADQPPRYTQPEPPAAEIPRWAFQQTLLIDKFEQVAHWWITNRQLATGEFGGALGDDSDLVQNWPGLALMDGPAPEIGRSARLVMDACYREGDVVDGLNAMRTDALHAYEEGMNALPLQVLLEYGNPVIIEECMATARHYPRLTGINSAGHRHFRSYTYSTTDLIEEGYHARQDRYSALIFHPGLYLAWYNGHEGTRRILTEYADALLEHWVDDKYPDLAMGIMFATDEEISHAAPAGEVLHLLWGCYDLTGDDKYLWPLRRALEAGDYGTIVSINGRALEALGDTPPADSIVAYARSIDVWDHNLQTDERGSLARTLAWSATGDNLFLEDYQAALLRHMDQNMYLYTEAHQYTDRIWLLHRSTQRVRLGGIPHYRGAIYPGHAVSWENTGGEVAFLVLSADRKHLRINAYNLSPRSRTVTMRPWQLANGAYTLRVGADRDEDKRIDRNVPGRTVRLKRYSPVEITLPSRRNMIIELDQTEPGADLNSLPDLALAAEEFRLDASDGALNFRVHNIGSVRTGNFRLRAVDDRGRELLDREFDSIDAPLDLRPKTVEVSIASIPAGWGRIDVSLDPEDRIEEITEANNIVRFRR